MGIKDHEQTDSLFYKWFKKKLEILGRNGQVA